MTRIAAIIPVGTLEGAKTRLGEMLDAWLFGRGLHELAEYGRNVRDVTAQQIQRLAEECFDVERIVEAVVRGAPRKV